MLSVGVKDCIHDVFVKIYTNRAKLTPTDNIIAYLTNSLSEVYSKPYRNSSCTVWLYIWEYALESPSRNLFHKRESERVCISEAIYNKFMSLQGQK